MKRISLIFLILIVASLGRPQFDEGEPSVELEAEESTPPTLDVSSKDYERLKKALAEKNEDVVVAAASNILGKNPKDKKALNALAVFYLESDRIGLAKMIIERAQKDHPKDPALFNNKGVVRLKEGDIRGAIAEFRSAIGASRGHQTAGTNLGSIFVEFKDYERAKVPLKDGYEAQKGELRRGEPQAVQVANNYAVALMGSGDFSRAKSVFEDILDTETRNNDVMLNYAILLIDVMKTPDRAKEVLGRLKFVSEDPTIIRKVQELENRAKVQGQGEK